MEKKPNKQTNKNQKYHTIGTVPKTNRKTIKNYTTS